MDRPAAASTDELDRKIDAALDRVGAFIGFWFRVAVAMVLLVVLGVLVLVSPWVNTLAWVLGQILFGVTVVILELAALFWLLLARPRAHWIMPGDERLGFSDYVGSAETVEGARQTSELLRGAQKLRDLGGELRRGLLLVGPAGSGKTYLARCIAAGSGVPFCYVSARELRARPFGLGRLTIGRLYGKADAVARDGGACIVFVDEIDALAGGTAPIDGDPLSELLLGMDPPQFAEDWHGRLLRAMGLRAGRAPRPGVLTIAATSKAETLDSSLRVPGRFDRQIEVPLPDTEARKTLLSRRLADLARDMDLSVDTLAEQTSGLGPAAINRLVDEAAATARAGRHALTHEDFSLPAHTT